MSFDDQIRTALDSATTSLREHLEAELHAFAQEVVRVSMEERQRAVAAASQAATAEIRVQAEALVADVRSQAEAQVSQFRAAAHKNVRNDAMIGIGAGQSHFDLTIAGHHLADFRAGL